MRYTTKTEYGLVCLVYMAQSYPQQMTIKELIKTEQYSIPYVEKILQSLRAAKIVESHQGIHGGYTLKKHPSDIKVRDVIEALEGSTFDVFCDPFHREKIVCTHFCMCGVRPLWHKTKNILDAFYESITLEMIAKDEKEVVNTLTH